MARISEQLHLVELAEPEVKTVVPDVAVLEGGARGSVVAQSSTAVATLDAVTIDLPAEELVEIRDLWIEIHHRPGRSLVTAIEILSPTNKAGEGYWDYLSKRRKMIHQNVHLVELDSADSRTQAAYERYVAPGGSLRDCLAGCVQTEVRGLRLVCAPAIAEDSHSFLPPDPDVILDLPALFALGYERGRYARELDYSAPLDLPLAPADRTWAEELVKQTRA